MRFLNTKTCCLAGEALATPRTEGEVRRLLVVAGLLPSVLGGLWLVAASAQTASNTGVAQAMQQGSAAMTSGDSARAVASYSLVTRLQPNFAEAYLNLGLAEDLAGKLDEAHAALATAAGLKPSLRGPNLFLGTIAYRQNRFKEAEVSFLRETRLDPRSAKAWMWLGVCRLAEDNPQEAIPALDKAYALEPSDVDILYHRGRAYLLVANASYAAMYNLDHDSSRVHQVLAEAYAQAYRTQDAIKEFELAAKMAPRQPGPHEELGDQYWIAGQLDKAGDAYREELKIDPRAVSAMYKLGSLLVQNQNPTEGVQLLRDTLRADPSLADAHYYLGTGLMSMDRDEDAVHEFELAIAADPSSGRATSSYYKMAQADRKLHRVSEAKTAYENFRRMKAGYKDREDRKSTQLVRKRTELPVEDSAEVSMSVDH